jgi:hypothetical protein
MMEDTPRFVVETVESDDDSALQKMSAQPRRYFYPKDGSVLSAINLRGALARAASA